MKIFRCLEIFRCFQELCTGGGKFCYMQVDDPPGERNKPQNTCMEEVKMDVKKSNVFDNLTHAN